MWEYRAGSYRTVACMLLGHSCAFTERPLSMLRQIKATAPRTRHLARCRLFYTYTPMEGGARMPKTLGSGQAYAGRREDVAVVNLSMDRAAAELLRHYAGGKTMGRFVARLMYEYHARQEERQRLREQMVAILGEEEATS